MLSRVLLSTYTVAAAITSAKIAATDRIILARTELRISSIIVVLYATPEPLARLDRIAGANAGIGRFADILNSKCFLMGQRLRWYRPMRAFNVIFICSRYALNASRPSISLQTLPVSRAPRKDVKQGLLMASTATHQSDVQQYSATIMSPSLLDS